LFSLLSLSLHDALPIYSLRAFRFLRDAAGSCETPGHHGATLVRLERELSTKGGAGERPVFFLGSGRGCAAVVSAQRWKRRERKPDRKSTRLNSSHGSIS